MSSAASAGVDLIRELRLRQWARRHHVPVEFRSASWHPVVLDEMTRKDAEQAEQAAQAGLSSPFVPLIPNTLHLLHEAHAGIAAPKLLSQQSRVGDLAFG